MKGTLNAFKLNGCIKYNVKNTNPVNVEQQQMQRFL